MSSIVLLSAFRTSDREKMIHDMAVPFFDLAEKLENARLNGLDSKTWKAVLETNSFIWRYIADFLPRNFDQDVSEETTTMLKNVADYMPRAARAVLKAQQSDVCAQMVTLNRNMYNQILTMRAGA